MKVLNCLAFFYFRQLAHRLINLCHIGKLINIRGRNVLVLFTLELINNRKNVKVSSCDCITDTISWLRVGTNYFIQTNQKTRQNFFT